MTTSRYPTNFSGQGVVSDIHLRFDIDLDKQQEEPTGTVLTDPYTLVFILHTIISIKEDYIVDQVEIDGSRIEGVDVYKLHCNLSDLPGERLHYLTRDGSNIDYSVPARTGTLMTIHFGLSDHLGKPIAWESAYRSVRIKMRVGERKSGSRHN